MRRLFWILLLIIIPLSLPVIAQDALNLPSELYVLTTEGRVQRFGLGSEGVSTVTPEGEFVIDFRMAPGANWLAYRTQEGLYLTNIFDEGSTPRQLEDSRASIPLTRGRGETIAWSHDSSAIAYTTEYGGRIHFVNDGTFADVTTPDLINLEWSPDGRFLAAEAEGNVWWIFQRNNLGMQLRAAIPGANGTGWLAGEQLLYAPVEGGLVILDLSAGNQQIEVLSSAVTYYQPSITRDGQVVVFNGTETEATLVQVTIDENFIGTPTVIGSGTVDLTGTRWSPGGFLLTAFQGGAIALVNPVNGSGFTLPVSTAATYSWGPEYPQLISNQPMANPVTFLAPDLTGIQQVWILPADGSRAETITPAALDITDYAIAPDGRQIAYVSNSILWRYVLNSDEDPQALLELGNSETVAPAWSAGNDAIYYRDEQAGATGIWRVTVDGEASLFVPDEDNIRYTNPEPALGAGVMLVNRNEEVALVDTTTSEVTPLAVNGSGSWQSGTQFIVVGDAQRATLTGLGIYLGDANTANQLTLILPLLGSFDVFDYRVLGGTLRMLVKNQVPGDVRLLDIPITGGEATIRGSAGNMVNPVLSPDGQILIGQRSPEGVLLLYDVVANTTRQIDIAPPVSRVRWQ